MPKIVPASHKKIIKKRTKKLVRNQSDRFMRVGESWRKPRGIDGAHRKKWKGQRKHNEAGLGSCKETRFLLPCGFYKFLVHNVDELKTITMVNDKFAAEIAHGVSLVKREKIIKEARKLRIRVLNEKARFHTEEME
eukprot:gnl/Dysnectes_brevis/104_a124_10184.p2 GENE.gnl/Dysnectes_brevis/104_a124_10184~~gnl/Dysnectes_brevis/104_a124_10184.p2  ORF type:complete len:136 (+),score=40.24 gnl/Dysnectes_brevis/104_a124_10184:523-930(+)